MALKPYTFFKHDGASAAPPFELAELDDDAEARVHALNLLAQAPRYQAIEVWDEQGEAFTVKRP